VSDERTIKLLDIHHPCSIRVDGDGSFRLEFLGIDTSRVQLDSRTAMSGDSILTNGKLADGTFSLLRIVTTGNSLLPH
jgi:hypothetical protein